MKAGGCGFESHLTSLFLYENRKEGSQVRSFALPLMYVCMNVCDGTEVSYISVYITYGRYYLKAGIIPAIYISECHSCYFANISYFTFSVK